MKHPLAIEFERIIALARAATPHCKDVRPVAGSPMTCLERSGYDSNIHERCLPCRATACLNRADLEVEGWANWMAMP